MYYGIVSFTSPIVKFHNSCQVNDLRLQCRYEALLERLRVFLVVSSDLNFVKNKFVKGIVLNEIIVSGIRYSQFKGIRH